MKKHNVKGFASGFVTALLIVCLAGTALAYQKQATLNYTGVKIVLDGETVTPTNAQGNVVEPFIMDGTTYLPVRGIASALGLSVDWNQSTQTVTLNSGDTQQPSGSDGKNVGINGTIKSGSFDISIVDAQWTDALKTSLGTVTPEKEGNKLLCLTFSAKNTTDSTTNVANANFNAYADGKKVLPKVVLGYVDEAMVFVGAVSPGMEIIGYSVWELPENCNEFQASYLDDWAGESEQSFVIHPSDIK